MADFATTVCMLAVCCPLLLTVRAQQGPNIPIISGPTAVVSDVSNSWRCVVDEASSSAPVVYWQFGNGTRLSTDTFNNKHNEHRDVNNVDIQVSSVLTLRLSGPGAVQLLCVAVHYETQAQNTAYTTVTVLPSQDETTIAV